MPVMMMVVTTMLVMTMLVMTTLVMTMLVMSMPVMTPIARATLRLQAPPRDGIGERPQLRVPVWILGARMLFTGLDGTGRHDGAMTHDPDVPFARQLAQFEVGGASYQVDASRPFVAFMSETQGFLCAP